MGGKVIPETKTAPDKNGVYEAEVIINGKKKFVPSSFFPERWDRVDVLKAVGEAYENKQLINQKRGLYSGYTSSGIKVEMYLNNLDGTIKTAYPKYVD